jgi:hypothetical protein
MEYQLKRRKLNKKNLSYGPLPNFVKEMLHLKLYNKEYFQSQEIVDMIIELYQFSNNKCNTLEKKKCEYIV